MDGLTVTFGGVRGSRPTSGEQFVRYGGHTSCVAVGRRGDDPIVLLDAGTGLVTIADVLHGRPFRGTLLLSHLHWDHVMGIPFFTAGDRPDAEVQLIMPDQGDPVALLARMMSPPMFPIDPFGLRCAWTFRGLPAGTHRIDGVEVLALDVPHGGGRTFGYRLELEGCSIAYLPDHCPLAVGPGPSGVGELHAAALALAQGVDLLIHDAQFTAAELDSVPHFGHSAIEYAVQLAEHAQAQRLVLFHHAPFRTDDQLDQLAATTQARSNVGVIVAREGMTLDLPPPAPAVP